MSSEFLMHEQPVPMSEYKELKITAGENKCFWADV